MDAQQLTRDGGLDRSNSSSSSFSFEDLTQETFAARSSRKLWEHDPFDDFADSSAGPGVKANTTRNARPSRLPGSVPIWEEDNAVNVDPIPKRRVTRKVGLPGTDEMKMLPPPRPRAKVQAEESVISKFGPWPWRFGWAMAVIMMGRLVFSDGGMIDYHKKQQILVDRNLEFESIRAENKALKDEIYRIRNVPRVQKELARTHLGLISEEEFLVMFAGESSGLAR